MNKEDVRVMVEESLNKVFGGNARPNEGKIENHSSDKLREYYLALGNNEEWAKKIQKEKFEKIANIDIGQVCKDIDE